MCADHHYQPQPTKCVIPGGKPINEPITKATTRVNVKPTAGPTSEPIDQAQIEGKIGAVIGNAMSQIAASVDQDCGQKLQASSQGCLSGAKSRFQTSDNSK